MFGLHTSVDQKGLQGLLYVSLHEQHSLARYHLTDLRQCCLLAFANPLGKSRAIGQLFRVEQHPFYGVPFSTLFIVEA